MVSAEVRPPTATWASLAGGPIADRRVPGGASLEIPLRLQAPTSGIARAELAIVTSSLLEPETVVPLAVGFDPAGCLLFVPKELDFGPTAIGGLPAERTISAYNVCAQGVDVAALALVPGASAEFRLLPPTGPTTVPPGESFDFKVAYAPTNPGTDLSAVLVSIAGTERPHLVPLSGTGAE